GAARELGEAVIVNPFDIEGMAEAILQGLDMPLGERKDRWAAMMKVVELNDITAWREKFVRALSASDTRRGLLRRNISSSVIVFTCETLCLKSFYSVLLRTFLPYSPGFESSRDYVAMQQRLTDYP